MSACRAAENGVSPVLVCRLVEFQRHPQRPCDVIEFASRDVPHEITQPLGCHSRSLLDEHKGAFTVDGHGRPEAAR